jgi:hypothetical protein
MINALLLLTIAVAYTLFMLLVEKRAKSDTPLSDDEVLATLAVEIGCSIYDLFGEAGKHWNATPEKILQDFNHYLKTNHLPPYMRQFLRSIEHPPEVSYQARLFSGGKLPPSWSA